MKKKFILSAIACSLAYLPMLTFADQKNSAQTADINQNKDQDPGIVFFTPPQGWLAADASLLPPHVKVMVVGKGQHPFPPSINLSTESYKGTLKQYLKIVKAMNDSRGDNWKDLGMIATAAGNASLSQVDSKTEWGDVRKMHVILLKNGNIYILTSSAIKEEFPRFYKDFFTSMRSLQVNKDIYEIIKSPQLKKELAAAVKKLEDQWISLLNQQKQAQPEANLDDLKTKIFDSEHFQTTFWVPFKEMINQKYVDLGPEWKNFVLQKTEDNLFEIQL